MLEKGFPAYEQTSSTKRIAKNTLMLYFRQILIMLVSLYTVRVVLNTLGAEDYGIYNVVAGVVVLFSFVNTAMASGIQRFLNFYLGKNDLEKTNQVYSSSIIILLIISLIFIFMAETLGLWFVSKKLNIPIERHNAAMIAYQFTIVTTVFSIMRIPYSATVIAYEKMSFFAWTSIVEAVFKLLVAFVLKVFSFDTLILYAILLTVVAMIITFIYKIFCNKKFSIAHYKKVTDYRFVKELVSFSGWSLFGATANVCNSQGINLILNIFTNVVVNASMGIANQVNSVIYSFVSNFQTAFNPQLIKNYSHGDNENFLNLIKRSAKISFFLFYFIFLPFYANMEFVLQLWLKNVPDYSYSFVKLILLWSLVDIFNNPIYTAIQATGEIKFYNIFVSLFKILPLPVIILLFMNNFSPNWIFYTEIIFAILIDLWRIVYAAKKLHFEVKEFLIDIIGRSSLIIALSFPSTLLIKKYTENMNSFIAFLLICLFSVMCNLVLYFTIGLTKQEKDSLLSSLCFFLGGHKR